MVSGIFWGGAAQGLQRQEAISQQYDINQKKLQLLQQSQQMQQQREAQQAADKALANGWSHVEDTIDAFLNAGHSRAEASAAVQPILQGMKELAMNNGNPNAASLYDSYVAAKLAGPSQAQNERALAQARDPYRGQIEALTIQEKRANIAQMKSDTALESAAASAGQPGATQTGQPSVSPDQKGEAFLASLPADVRPLVKGTADYDINPNTFSTRTTKGMTRSRREIITDLASQYAAARGDTYDQTQYGARSKAVSSFTTGKQGDTVRAFNVLTDHLGTLKDAADALGNRDTQAFNRIANTVSSATGNPAPTNFDAVKAVVKDELNKAVLGGAGALGDRESIGATVDNASSPAQLAGVIDTYTKLAGGQLGGLRQQYESTTGRKDFDKFLNARTKKFFSGQSAGQDNGPSWSATPGGTQYRILP